VTSPIASPTPRRTRPRGRQKRRRWFLKRRKGKREGVHLALLFFLSLRFQFTKGGGGRGKEKGRKERGTQEGKKKEKGGGNNIKIFVPRKGERDQRGKEIVPVISHSNIAVAGFAMGERKSEQERERKGRLLYPPFFSLSLHRLHG